MDTVPALRVCTYNIHKGFSQFNRRMVVHELRERLRSLDVDVVFLQEVQGLHLGHANLHPNWPGSPQHEFLAEDVWSQFAYGGNAVYDHGHHGNAVLSRYPIVSSTNQDVSDHRFERRGLLHCEVQVPGIGEPVHCVCAHLGLMAGSRRRQMGALAERMEQVAPDGAPLIIAGDFNDWRNRADQLLARRLGLREAFDRGRGEPARSFPSTVPVLCLDRIYVRGFRVRQAQVHCGLPWSRISDHAALTADLEFGG
ncbi:endonuclease/exonuclease/phosphatase family protein [Aromatoleum bremense]|uniref:EEP domain-containing protein n=1 Tax=Aromatoleum bremense TaxID=76115 RepID=A0ABX1NX36_9RHOO|nr:endonuclease/exonuclease/phosphatase family protein [Aromatoleum bremense]NMG16579.1 EEP domain-containing protein [Aromatoleum bremense]QTQ31174.1 Endonuclease/Exonuclease/phosphatase family protein [Aromatoleum bremense]